MASFLIWIFLISVWNSILFYQKDLGISVILFIIPLLLLIYYILKSQGQIKNKNGLLWMIPIVLLSLTYFLFDSSFFSILNIPVLFILFLLMYLYTIKPTFDVRNIICNLFILLSKPLDYFSNVLQISLDTISKTLKISDKSKQKIRSLIIILPIVIVVLLLLSTADQIFGSIFENMFSILENLSLSKILGNLIGRSISVIILFLYLSATIYFLLYHFLDIKIKDKKDKLILDNQAIKLLLIILNIIYIVFDIIQVKSLILHQVSMDISYAEYAREGFFQLMFVSLLNLIIILLAKSSENKNNSKFIIKMSITMIFLTFIIIISAFIRMYMYESQYGYTILRLLVYITLITEIILLIPTIKYILNSKFNIVKYYIIILITVYTAINFINVDYIIASRNINRYYEKNEIDLIYLENYHADNIPLLVELYNKTYDSDIKNELEWYFDSIDLNISGFQEWNFSKLRAIKKINAIEKNIMIKMLK